MAEDKKGEGVLVGGVKGPCGDGQLKVASGCAVSAFEGGVFVSVAVSFAQRVTLAIGAGTKLFGAGLPRNGAWVEKFTVTVLVLFQPAAFWFGRVTPVTC